MFVRVGRNLIVNKKYIYIINLIEHKLVLSGKDLRGEFTLKASKESLIITMIGLQKKLVKSRNLNVVTA